MQSVMFPEKRNRSVRKDVRIPAEMQNAAVGTANQQIVHDAAETARVQTVFNRDHQLGFGLPEETFRIERLEKADVDDAR